MTAHDNPHYDAEAPKLLDGQPDEDLVASTSIDGSRTEFKYTPGIVTSTEQKTVDADLSATIGDVRISVSLYQEVEDDLDAYKKSVIASDLLDAGHAAIDVAAAKLAHR